MQHEQQRAESKKFKSKWFRIATAGDTTDGREIQENWIQEIAETYNPQTYGARINVEHIRSVLPDSSFGAYGNVIAVKAEKVDVNGEKKLTLFAQIEPNDNLIALNKRNQKFIHRLKLIPILPIQAKPIWLVWLLQTVQLRWVQICCSSLQKLKKTRLRVKAA